MKNRVWKYCRQAGYDGDDSGIQAQEFRINEYISKHELIPVGESKVFESGTTMDRPSLHELMQKAQEQAYDILVVSAFDRLGRDLWLTMGFVRELLRMGIRIIDLSWGSEITEWDIEQADNLLKSISK
ncbi:MAG: recombinase family protein [Lachnospirales bacterium]